MNKHNVLFILVRQQKLTVCLNLPVFLVIIFDQSVLRWRDVFSNKVFAGYQP